MSKVSWTGLDRRRARLWAVRLCGRPNKDRYCVPRAQILQYPLYGNLGYDRSTFSYMGAEAIEWDWS